MIQSVPFLDWHGMPDMLTFPKHIVHTLKAHGIFRDIRKPSWTSPAPQTHRLKAGAPMGTKRPSTWRPGGLAAPVTHTRYILKLPLHGGRSSLTGSPAFTVIKNDSIDRFVWCLLIYLRFIPGNSWLYPSRTVTLTSPPAARQTGFGYSCS